MEKINGSKNWKHYYDHPTSPRRPLLLVPVEGVVPFHGEAVAVPAEVVVVVVVAKELATTVVVAEAATEAVRMDPPT